MGKEREAGWVGSEEEEEKEEEQRMGGHSGNGVYGLMRVWRGGKLL